MIISLIGYILSIILVFNGLNDGITELIISGFLLFFTILISSFFKSQHYKIMKITKGMSVGEVSVFMLVLALKNKKGVLGKKSKRYCQHYIGLMHMAYGEYLKSSLDFTSREDLIYKMNDCEYRLERAFTIGVETDRSYLYAGTEVFKKFGDTLLIHFFSTLVTAARDKKTSINKERCLEIARLAKLSNQVEGIFKDMERDGL